MRITENDYSDDFEAWQAEFGRRNRRQRAPGKPGKRPPLDRMQILADLTDFSDIADDFVPSYVRGLDPKHYERQWVIDSLGGFYRDNVIADVTRIVKGGKEANVYCCLATAAAGIPLIAAKLYRPRMLRHLRNDALYREGRLVLDSEGKEVYGAREARAMRKKTRFGHHLNFMTWIMHEFQVQTELYEAGADVPQPVAQRGNTLLMAFLGDEWSPAPTLNEIAISRDEAAPLFERVMRNVRLFLGHHYVHADLSAYNILYWQGEIALIDFPQVVDARLNRNAWMLLQRDVRRVCQYFARFGVEVNWPQLAFDLWDAYQSGQL